MPTLTNKRIDVKIISVSKHIENFYAGEVIADRMTGPTNVSFRKGDIVYINKVYAT